MRTYTIIFKTFTLIVLLSLSTLAKAQEPCEITCSAEMPICSEATVTLSVPNNYLYSYLWSPGGQTTNSIVVRPFETTNYSVEIREEASGDLICNPELRVEVKPRFEVDFRQVKLTCSNREEENGRNAQVLAWVDSTSVVYEPPFNYQWEVSPLHIAPNDPSWAIGLEAYKYYYIRVTDNRGCTQLDSVKLKAYPNPVVEISTDPGDTVYLQNPHVTYSFENLSVDSLDISNFYWILNSTYNITSTEKEPRFTYVETGDYITELKVYNPQGCDTSYYKTIKVEPVKLKIPNVFTPNGDGTNDYFIISLDGGSDLGGGGLTGGGTRDDGGGHQFEYEGYEPLNRYYESSELTVFNRWGRIVYHSKDYHNDWDGGDLSDGTYFYVLKCHGLKQDATYQGSVMIIKSQRQ
ncbi:MAG: gliding motility-associated C-terminal domain-containing protein [Bacteroidales bacterium]|nr:gliding motility-associated C-terminal domain-containing protein [Bacteroidales bacterium]